jgi:hypothetical protein
MDCIHSDYEYIFGETPGESSGSLPTSSGKRGKGKGPDLSSIWEGCYENRRSKKEYLGLYVC